MDKSLSLSVIQHDTHPLNSPTRFEEFRNALALWQHRISLYQSQLVYTVIISQNWRMHHNYTTIRSNIKKRYYINKNTQISLFKLAYSLNITCSAGFEFDCNNKRKQQLIINSNYSTSQNSSRNPNFHAIKRDK